MENNEISNGNIFVFFLIVTIALSSACLYFVSHDKLWQSVFLGFFAGFFLAYTIFAFCKYKEL